MIRAKLRKKPRVGKNKKEKMKEEIAATLLRIKVVASSRTTKPHQDKVGFILSKIATSNTEDCTCGKLAKSLKVNPNDLDVYLRHLIDRRFITRNTNRDGDCWYATTKAGRDYLVQHEDLLEGKSSA